MFRLIILSSLIVIQGFAAPQSANRNPNQEDRCPTIQKKGYQIGFAKPTGDADPVLQVKNPEGKQLSYGIQSQGPSNNCRKLFFFPERNVIILDYFSGESSTKITNRTIHLFVYKVTATGIDSIADFVIENSDEFHDDPKSSGPVYSVKNTYTEPKLAKERVKKGNQDVTEDRVVFEIKDSSGNTVSTLSY
jgi:hypothetical protein